MLCTAMADALGVKLAELRAKHTTALRKALSAMLTAIFDNWAAVNPQFHQYCRLHGGAPDQGAFKYSKA